MVKDRCQETIEYFKNYASGEGMELEVSDGKKGKDLTLKIKGPENWKKIVNIFRANDRLNSGPSFKIGDTKYKIQEDPTERNPTSELYSLTPEKKLFKPQYNIALRIVLNN